MSSPLCGFPFWILEYEKSGAPVGADKPDTIAEQIVAAHISDLFVFSHGWNNDRTKALDLYQRFFTEVRKIVDNPAIVKTRPDAVVGIAGVIWPSILWPDDAASATMTAIVPAGTGAAASFGTSLPVPVATTTIDAIAAELCRAYTDPAQQALINDLVRLLRERTSTDLALAQFKTKLGELLTSEPTDGQVDKVQPDSAAGNMAVLPDARWKNLLVTLANRAPRPATSGGAVGLGDPFAKLWEGAKDALRIATYWQMKQRAGIVGRNGLGPFLTMLRDRVRVHLLGHSFGARLVSFSLSGLGPEVAGPASPVKSLFLLQGAFSHYAFADALPHDSARAGALKGMAERVDGPLLTTHSLKDIAVGVEYPAASFASQDDAAALADQVARWGAMGHDGAQAVNAVSATLAVVGTRYALRKCGWLNLDGNNVIIHGGLPSGAHSDIVHPQTAWAALAAAGLVPSVV